MLSWMECDIVRCLHEAGVEMTQIERLITSARDKKGISEYVDNDVFEHAKRCEFFYEKGSRLSEVGELKMNRTAVVQGLKVLGYSPRHAMDLVVAEEDKREKAKEETLKDETEALLRCLDR